MSQLNSRVDAQDAGELQIFIDQVALELEMEDWKSPLEEVQEDVINHLTEIRDLLDTKIRMMEMRTKNIY
jgi:uncharacterized membrane-anchored protein YhcB (DUF1043 family)